MTLLSALFTAFSMYSIIPMPRTEWEPKSMKYAMCFFSLVGAVVGTLLFLWTSLTIAFMIGGSLFSAGAVALPVVLSGAIHMDGFCDTTDALSSRQPTERKLEILKDSHTGAFAIIGCVLYFLLSFGLWTELQRTSKAVLVLSLGFILSRTLSGLSVVWFRCAKNSGLLAAFSDAAAKQRVRIVLLIYLMLCAAVMLWVHPVFGGAALLAAGVMFAVYRLVSYRQFGGTTGDLAGWFLQLCELFMLFAVVMAQKTMQLIH